MNIRAIPADDIANSVITKKIEQVDLDKFLPAIGDGFSIIAIEDEENYTSYLTHKDYNIMRQMTQKPKEEVRQYFEEVIGLGCTLTSFIFLNFMVNNFIEQNIEIYTKLYFSYN